MPTHSIIAACIVLAVAASFSLAHYLRARRECRATMRYCAGFGRPACPPMSDRDRAMRAAMSVRP